MNNLLLLAYEFFKTGLFAVGGGLATIPFLAEMAEKYGWFTLETLSTMIAVSESTPGPIGVNMSTYVGYTTGGLLGSLVSTLSLVAPSVIVVTIIAQYFKKFKDAKIVQDIFSGLKPAVVAFVVSACLSLFVSTFFESATLSLDWKSLCLFVVLFFISYKKPKIHPIFLIILAACVGILFKF